MTGFKSKKTAALDEEGMYLVHQTDHMEVVLTMVAQPAQEPVAWGVDWGKVGDIPCVSIIKRFPDGVSEIMAVEYGPQRPWVGLTAKEAAECWTTSATQTWKNFEAKLKEKNT